MVGEKGGVLVPVTYSCAPIHASIHVSLAFSPRLCWPSWACVHGSWSSTSVAHALKDLLEVAWPRSSPPLTLPRWSLPVRGICSAAAARAWYLCPGQGGRTRPPYTWTACDRFAMVLAYLTGASLFSNGSQGARSAASIYIKQLCSDFMPLLLRVECALGELASGSCRNRDASKFSSDVVRMRPKTVEPTKREPRPVFARVLRHVVSHCLEFAVCSTVTACSVQVCC